MALNTLAIAAHRLARRLGGFALAAIIVLGLQAPGFALAQSDSTAPTLERQIYEAFDQGAYTRAIDLIEKALEHAPNHPDMLYNLACAHCLMKDYDQAASALLRAFKAGFRDLQHLRRDPDLSALREHPTYKAILEEADRASAKAARSAVDRWRDTYGDEHYRYESDPEHRINYAIALDETSHREMRQMLERQADQMIDLLFEQPPGYDVLIAVPTPEDSDKFFGGNDSIGGMYQHNLRRLVARDIGGSLRHEFFHVMHFAHMERLGQQHPLWIQEGMAALYEDYEFSDDGAIKFLPNDRQIIVKARAKGGRLTKWNDLFKMSAEAFMEKPQQLYPQARSIFEFIANENKLQPWYRAYVEHFDEDRTGAKAFEIAFSSPLDEIERSWKRWIAQQPEIDLQIRSDDAALGIRSRENASNDGVLISDIVPGSGAARAGLRRGDVIVALDGQSTRSLMDLRKLVAAKQVGDIVSIRARRSEQYMTIDVTLRPAYGGS
jgi:tetratricopeptide (TPR) repeat protein